MSAAAREPFGPDDDVKIWSREAYIGNEADSDEYRETQPWKLLSTIGLWADQMPGRDGADDFLAAVQAWISEAGHSYDGSEASKPLFAMIHDMLWDIGEHPYFEDYAALLEEYELDAEYADAGVAAVICVRCGQPVAAADAVSTLAGPVHTDGPEACPA